MCKRISYKDYYATKIVKNRFPARKEDGLFCKTRRLVEPTHSKPYLPPLETYIIHSIPEGNLLTSQ